MKTLKIISKELSEILKVKSPFIQKNVFWKFYCLMSGFHQDEYFMITFKHHQNRKELMIEETTENPRKILKLIKKIEPKVKVTFTKTINTLIIK